MRRGLKVGLGALGVTAALAAGRIAYVQWYFSTLPYEAEIRDLIEDPRLFRNARLDSFRDYHTGIVNTESYGKVKYGVAVRFAIDIENFVRDKVVLTLDTESEKLKKEIPEVLSDTIPKSLEYWKKYLKRKPRFLTELNPELPDLFLKELERYENWEKPVQLKYVDYFNGFDPAKKNSRKENELDSHIERTLKTSSSPGPFDQEELEAARKYLFEASERQDVDLSSLSVRESVEFLRKELDEEFYYVRSNPSAGPSRRFTDFVRLKSGHCGDFAFHGYRLFDEMRKLNPELQNTHVIPTIIGPRFLAKHGHAISSVFQTDEEKFSLVDFSNLSEDPKSSLYRRTIVITKK